MPRERKEHAIEEEPKQKAAQEERQRTGNADHPGGHADAAAGPCHDFPAGMLMNGDQLAAEAVGFLGKAAVDLRQQDCPGPLRFAFLAKCDHFFSPRVEVGPRLFQSEQEGLFFFRNGNRIADRRDPVLEARLQRAEFLLPGGIALVEKIGGKQIVAFEKSYLHFLGADAGRFSRLASSRRILTRQAAYKVTRLLRIAKRDDPQDRHGELGCQPRTHLPILPARCLASKLPGLP